MTLICSLLAISATTATWFPFPPPGVEVATGVVDLTSWNEKPAGAAGPIRVKDGHLVDGHGRRIRLFGTNLCFAACYPTHEAAEKLAARLASLGANVVRLHHTDTSYFPRGIWDPADKTRHTLSPEALDRYDYLVAQLIKHGIYVNVNLHVGRRPSEQDPSPGAASLPKYGKGVDNFWRPLIDLQKWYARSLLDRRNKYLGRKYAQEPGIAFVEISNEDSLTTLVIRRDGVDSLPTPYQEYLDQRWQEFLRKRYGTTAKLRAAWAEGEVPLGEEQVNNGDFRRGLEGWTLQSIKACKLAGQVVDGGPKGSRALKVEVTQTDSTGWHGQVFFAPIGLKQKRPYTLTLWLRADPPRSVAINVMRAHSLFGALGLRTTVSVGRQWKEYRFAFVAPADEDLARVTVSNLAQGKGTVWIAGVSLREGGIIGLPEGESLEKGSVKRLRPVQSSGRTPAAVRDQMLFYLELERSYWQEMYDYLKHDLGVQALVTGTQITYSPPYTQEMMDYADAHSYWQHPRFPGRPWDARNWYVQNISMVAHPPGTVGRLACSRLAGKPYTVSEYNHPAPNQYGGEAFLLLAAYGALQDWDAIYGFNFSSNDRWDVNYVTRYFDIKSHATQIISLPVAAAIFRKGLVAPARQLLQPSANLALALKLLARRQRSVSALDAGLRPGLELIHRVALRWLGTGAVESPGQDAQAQRPQGDSSAGKSWEADNGQLVWDVSQRGAEVVLLRTPAAKGVIGFCCGREYDLGDGVRVQVGHNSLNWAAITLCRLDGRSLAEDGALLITVASSYRNPDWGWRELGGGRVTVGANWGHGPAEVEGTPVELLLPVAAGRVKAWALDPRGGRKAEIKTEARTGGTRIHFGPEYQTLWYEIDVAGR